MAMKRFLQGPPCYLVKKEDKNSGLTHTLLDGWKGGKIRIPEDKIPDFLVAYAQDVKNNEKLYVNEIRRQHFRMFLDLDILNPWILSDTEIEGILSVVLNTFRRFFPKHESDTKFMCIVSDASPKAICVDHRSLEEVLNNKEKLDTITDPTLSPDGAILITEKFKEQTLNFSFDSIFKLPDGRYFRNTHRTDGNLKHGIHAVFPHIIVTSEEALYMREALIEALTLEYGEKYAYKGWSQVVDNAVYVNSGLRMIYSSKTKNCELCKNKNNGKDCVCEKGKDLSEGRPYELRFVYMNGKIDIQTTKSFQDNIIRLLSYATIYTSQCKVSEGWKRFEGCPAFGDIIAAKSNGPPRLASRERFFGEEKKTTRTWRNKIQITDTTIIEIIQTQIRTRFIKQYANIRVRSVVKDDKKYYVSVDGEGSNYCLNLNPPRDHKSNRIWFSVAPDGVRIRCFCSCMTTEGRHSGLCKNFETSARPLNPKDSRILFPNVEYSTGLFASSHSFLANLKREIEQENSGVKKKKMA